MHRGGGDHIRQSLMVKRSINKSKLGPVNYKNRVFSLTNTHVGYAEGTLDVSSNIFLMVLSFCKLISVEWIKTNDMQGCH